MSWWTKIWKRWKTFYHVRIEAKRWWSVILEQHFQFLFSISGRVVDCLCEHFVQTNHMTGSTMSGAGVLPKTQGEPKNHLYSRIHSKNLSSASCWWVIVTHLDHTQTYHLVRPSICRHYNVCVYTYVYTKICLLKSISSWFIYHHLEISPKHLALNHVPQKKSLWKSSPNLYLASPVHPWVVEVLILPSKAVFFGAAIDLRRCRLLVHGRRFGIHLSPHLLIVASDVNCRRRQSWMLFSIESSWWIFRTIFPKIFNIRPCTGI